MDLAKCGSTEPSHRHHVNTPGADELLLPRTDKRGDLVRPIFLEVGEDRPAEETRRAEEEDGGHVEGMMVTSVWMRSGCRSRDDDNDNDNGEDRLSGSSLPL